MAHTKRPANTGAGEKKTRMRFSEYTAANDIKYRGPLNYQSFMLFGWICIVLAVVVAILNIGISVSPDLGKQLGGIASVLSWIASLSLPFMLIANFSTILANKEGYSKQLIKNGIAALAIFFVTIVLGGRYLIGTAEQIVTPSEEVVPLLESIIRGLKPEGFLAFNLFIDLFMCTLTLYFLNARPKRVFTGKKLIIFRLFTILPIAYEYICLLLKIQTARGWMTLPLWSFPLLTVKPPMTFALFVFIAILMKLREYLYCKHGRTHEEYLEFMKTNRSSFHMSVRICLSMIAVAAIDLTLSVLLVSGHAASVLPAGTAAMTGETLDTITEAGAAALSSGVSVAKAVGIGKSVMLAAVAPLMLLYSYTSEPKRKIMNTLIPVGGILLIVLIVLETIRLGAGLLVGKNKIDIEVIRQWLKQISAPQ